LARRTAGLSALAEEAWDCCADDVDTFRPDNNASDNAKSNLFIAPLMFLIELVVEFSDGDARR
jgi:hypothetical protein